MVADADLAISTMAPGERDAIIDLWTRCGLTRPWNDPLSDIDLALAADNSTVLVARVGASIAGAAMTGHDGHRGTIYYLGVDPEARRGGVGRALVRAAETWCAGFGIPKLNLLVRMENLGVLAFYEALGYLPTNCVSLCHAIDPGRAEWEKEQKAAWARGLEAANGRHHT